MLTLGLVFIGIGTALLVSLNIGNVSGIMGLSQGPVFLIALIFLFVGIAITISYYLPRRKEEIHK